MAEHSANHATPPRKPRTRTGFDQEILASQVTADRFPFQCEGVAEALYVLEGDFVNEGQQYRSGTSLPVENGKLHGPHSLEGACKILVLWTAHAATQEGNLGDFTMAKVAAATPVGPAGQFAQCG